MKGSRKRLLALPSPTPRVWLRGHVQKHGSGSGNTAGGCCASRTSGRKPQHAFGAGARGALCAYDVGRAAPAYGCPDAGSESAASQPAGRDVADPAGGRTADSDVRGRGCDGALATGGRGDAPLAGPLQLRRPLRGQRRQPPPVGPNRLCRWEGRRPRKHSEKMMCFTCAIRSWRSRSSSCAAN